MNKVYLYVAGIGSALVAGVMAFSASAQTLSTTTLGTAIDSVNSTWYGYFLVLLSNYWPFVVGVGVILLVWHFGRRAIEAFR
jgi:hypothetical protein